MADDSEEPVEGAEQIPQPRETGERGASKRKPPEAGAEQTALQASAPQDRETRLAEARGALLEEEEGREQRPGLLRRIKRWLATRRERAAQRRGEAVAGLTSVDTVTETPAVTTEVEQIEVVKRARRLQEEATLAPVAPPRGVEPPEAGQVTPTPGAAESAGAPPSPRPSLFPRLRRSKDRPTEVEPEEAKIREIALEGYGEPEPEPEAVREPATLDEQLQQADKQILKAVRELRGPERRLLMGLLIGIAVIGVFAGLYLGISAVRVAVATPVPEHVSIVVPEPTRLELPGGWSFILAKGAAVDGRWQPQGAEWLSGTEVCRWVSLPWSLQLEAVIRTLAPGDELILTMSNTDQLTYRVQSIREIDVEDVGRLDQNSPCLHALLTNPRSGSRWVVTALP